jgi:hypothetical protein
MRSDVHSPATCAERAARRGRTRSRSDEAIVAFDMSGFPNQRCTVRRWWLLLCPLLLILWLPSSAYAVKYRDTLTTVMGDRLVGEFKELTLGKVTFDTEATGKIAVKWDNVLDVRSPRFFRVELANGRLVFGSLAADTTRRVLLVLGDSTVTETPFDAVFTISEIKFGFWGRFYVSLSLGVSYTKASEVGQVSISGNSKLPRDLDLTTLSFSLISTSSQGAEPAQRHDVTLQNLWYLGYGWFTMSSLKYQRNTELGLAARYSFGIGGGQYLLQVVNQYFYAVGGLNGTWEQGGTSVLKPWNLEAMAGLEYSLLQYHDPEINLLTDLNAYPNLTTWGRVRVDFEVKLRWEVFKKFFWELQVYNNFDNQPPSGESQKNDYGIVLSLGWSYG